MVLWGQEKGKKRREADPDCVPQWSVLSYCRERRMSLFEVGAEMAVCYIDESSLNHSSNSAT